MPAQGVAQQVDRAQPERLQKRDRVAGHGFDAVGGGAAGAADAPEVDQDDAPPGGDAVDHGGVPVVEYRGEVVQEHHGHARGRARLAVGERGPADLHGLGDGFLAGCRHGSSFLSLRTANGALDSHRIALVI